jgi:hypothetical protein
MRPSLRALLIGIGIADAILAVGFALRLPWATGTWPWAEGRLTYLFLASMLAAVSVALLWIGVTGEWGALPAGALNLVVMMGGIAVRADDGKLLAYAIGAGIAALACLGAFLWSLRLPVAHYQPLPRAVRASYILFAAVLVLVGGALILRRPNIMPWPIGGDTSTVVGWMFFGDAWYFAYAVARPYWQCARAQLWSFLVYDLVLIGPFIAHLDTVRPDLRPNLIVYIVVLGYSGGLAVYFLLLNPATRLWQPRPTLRPAEV